MPHTPRSAATQFEVMVVVKNENTQSETIFRCESLSKPRAIWHSCRSGTPEIKFYHFHSFLHPNAPRNHPQRSIHCEPSLIMLSNLQNPPSHPHRHHREMGDVLLTPPPSP